MPDEIKETVTPGPRAAIHPKELSPEYHKAHKQLMLWAAILFVWEFVGIDLDKAKDAEGYAGALVKSIKSPQAVPWVLLALVLYFLFKCSTEWGQCHLDRRKMRFARIDFISAWIVAVAAIALYVGQAISRVQIADLLQGPSTRVSILFGLVAGLFLGSSLSRLFELILGYRANRHHGLKRMWEWLALHLTMGLLAVPITLISAKFLISVSVRPVLYCGALTLGAFLQIGSDVLFRRRAWAKEKAELTAPPKK